ncbi:hypothetical protein K6V25_13730 [Bacteroides salyersiae]|uniref:hypothetical protein n=1 Tax=Bacteroides salyersiae TaxID=291644 RepID=UPI001CCB3C47|nr:hypothetical protein [Bacteroides salyersiae]UBD64000.1 hypothetical protein K6V25_13730 [Bacteroides salyersiae]
MIERLNQLSLYDFIELSCGDCTVLLSPGEEISEVELKKRSSDLIIEYKRITNPSGLNSVLMDREDMVKERTRVLLFKLCVSLIAIGAYEDVRETLAMLSYDMKSMSDEQVKSKVEELLRSALFEQKRSDEIRSDNETEKATPEQIRSSFDAEIAFIMTFFKMNIDVRNINAAVYANIVHQVEIEVNMRKKVSN